MSQPFRCGLVGAGRRRQGTGPFLARFVEAAGGVVTGCVGRNPERGAVAAAQIAQDLGHGVDAFDNVENLLSSGLDALVIAAPDEAHAAALRLAAAAGVPVLCEKPLVPYEESELVEPLLQTFSARDLLLMEGCQWPFVAAAVAPMLPSGASARRLTLRLSPGRPGPSALRSSASHIISLAQHLWPVTASTALEAVEFTGSGGAEDGLTVDFDLRNPPSEGQNQDLGHCRLELRVCPEPPRPAWIEIDGYRMERQLDPETYAMTFVAADKSLAIDDPTRTLVYRFAEQVRAPSIERIRAESAAIATRAGLYASLLERFLADGSRGPGVAPGTP